MVDSFEIKQIVQLNTRADLTKKNVATRGRYAIGENDNASETE